MVVQPLPRCNRSTTMTGRQAGRHAGRQAGRQAGMQAGRQLARGEIEASIESVQAVRSPMTSYDAETDFKPIIIIIIIIIIESYPPRSAACSYKPATKAIPWTHLSAIHILTTFHKILGAVRKS